MLKKEAETNKEILYGTHANRFLDSNKLQEQIKVGDSFDAKEEQYGVPAKERTIKSHKIGKANHILERLKATPTYAHPRVMNTDKNSSYSKALMQLRKEGMCPQNLEYSQVKYLNNVIEADHGKLKHLIKPTLGFKSMKSNYATIKGFELMRMFKKGQFRAFQYNQGTKGEIRIITDNLLAC